VAGTGPFFGRWAFHRHQAMAENMDLSPLTRTKETYTFAREGVRNEWHLNFRNSFWHKLISTKVASLAMEVV
jgi:hypothetical protein